MFRCPITNLVTPPRTPRKMVVTRTRQKSYSNPDLENPGEFIITHGTEIVEAIGVSPEGFLILDEAAKAQGLELKVV